MKNLFQRLCSLYLIIYCGLILPPTGILAFLAYWGLCDPNPAPWLQKAALIGAIPVILCALIAHRRTAKQSAPKEAP